MSFDETPKTFAFGDLNPVSKPMAHPNFDPYNISVVDALREMIIAFYSPNSVAGTGPYKGVVLRVEPDMDQNKPEPGNWLASVFGPEGLWDGATTPKVLKRYKVRIPEIHTTLPVPTRYAASFEEPGDHQKIIDLYPTYVAMTSDTKEASPGDLVWVDYANKNNFEDPFMISPVFPTPDGAPNNPQTSASDAHGQCGANGAGAALPGSSGGSLSPDSRSSLTAEGASGGANGCNATYLPSSSTRTRNLQDPGFGVTTQGKPKFAELQAYVSKGGSGKAVSGTVGLGSCGSINNELAKYLTAYRIAVEDQADRGYAFGGQCLDATKGGIDCQGFVVNVRALAEHLIGTTGLDYGIKPPDGASSWLEREGGWKYRQRPWYGTTTKSKDVGWVTRDGWDWFDPAAAAQRGADITNSDLYKQGTNIYAPVDYFDVEGQMHIMPGDEVALTQRSPPDWVSSALKVSHIMCVFTDPDGNARMGESGGAHKGTGSTELSEYIEMARTNGYKLWVWQRPEWSRVWHNAGGRPNQPWTPELCRQLAGDEYFSATSLAERATCSATAQQVQVNGQGAAEPSNTPVEVAAATPVDYGTNENCAEGWVGFSNKKEGTGCYDPSVVGRNPAGEQVNRRVHRRIDLIEVHPGLFTQDGCPMGYIVDPNDSEYCWLPDGADLSGSEAPPTASGTNPPAHELQDQEQDPAFIEWVQPTSSTSSQEDCDAQLRQALEEAGLPYNASDLTEEQANRFALTTEECNQLGACACSTEALASSAAGRRALAQRQAIIDSFASCGTASEQIPETGSIATPTGSSSNSSAAAAANPSSSSSAGAECTAGSSGGAGGGPYSGGGNYRVPADRAGQPLGNVPLIGEFSEVTNNPKMALTRIEVDKSRQGSPGNGHPGQYDSSVKMREDVAPNLIAVRDILRELGAVLATAGTIRALSTPVSNARIATSFHYTSLGVDIITNGMGQNAALDEYVVEWNPDKERQMIVWARSDKTSGSVTRNGVTFEVEHKTLNAQKRHCGPTSESITIHPQTGYYVNLTRLMNAFGLEEISAYRSFVSNGTPCMGWEAWHFDFRKNAGLIANQTTFGNVLETIYDASEIAGKPPANSANYVWRGSYFGSP